MEIQWSYDSYGSNYELLEGRNTTFLDTLGRAQITISEIYRRNGNYDTLNTREYSYFGNGDLRVLNISYPDSCIGNSWEYYYEYDSLNRRTFYRYDRMDTWNCIEDTAFTFLVYSRYPNMLRVDSIHSIDFNQARLQIDSIQYDVAGRISVHREIFPTDTNSFGDLLETQHRYHYDGNGLIDSIETLHNGPNINVNGFQKAYSRVYRYDSLDREIFSSYRSFHHASYSEIITIYDTLLLVSAIEATHTDDNNYTVYPNPVNDVLIIKSATKFDREFQVVFTDIKGNILKLESDESGLRYFVSNLVLGLYFYEVRSTKGVERGKFLKE
jgi:hypothetical protein